MIKTKQYYLIPETTIINDPELAYVNVLRVHREGLGYNVTQNTVPGDREVVHEASAGNLVFLNEGSVLTGDGPVLRTAEKVSVTFKY